MASRALVFGITAVVGFGAQLPAQTAKCQSLELPADKDRIEVRVSLRTYSDFLNDTDNEQADEACLSLKADSNVEFELRLDANLGPITADIKEQAGIGEGLIAVWLASAQVENAATGIPHYEVLNTPNNVRRTVVLTYNKELVEQWLSEGRWLPNDGRGPIVTATLTRLAGNCYMWAKVWGDVNETYFGDVAYYNAFEKGVAAGAAAGTFMDPGQLEMLEGMMEWAAGFDPDAVLDSEDEPQDQAEADADSPDADSETIELGGESRWMKEFRTWAGENVGNDNFGLTLTDVKFDAKNPLAGAAGAVDFPGDGLGSLLSGFHVAYSGRLPEKALKEGVIMPEDARAILVTPGVVTAGTPGTDLFTWKEGRPGGARLIFRIDEGSPAIHGHVRASLTVERPHDPSIRRIEVDAWFRALPTAFACQ